MGKDPWSFFRHYLSDEGLPFFLPRPSDERHFLSFIFKLYASDQLQNQGRGNRLSIETPRMSAPIWGLFFNLTQIQIRRMGEHAGRDSQFEVLDNSFNVYHSKLF